jgi:DNA polymerase-1
VTRTALLDGDVYLFQASASCEYEANWGGGLWTLHADEGEAWGKILDIIEADVRQVKADDVIICLSDYDHQGWRKDIHPTYKQQRVKTRKPVVYFPLRERLEKLYRCESRPTLEGDDVLGIFATHPKLVETDTVIVTIDKDLQTGYKGCPGVGPVNAARILDEAVGACTPWANDAQRARCLWDAVVATYAKKKLGEEVALMNAQVARICRWTDYDYTRKRVIPWRPDADS